MATRLVRVRAATHLRRDLARWGRGHRGVRTVSSTEIGFPPDVFAQLPEELLAGALVDSQPYTPRAAAGRAGPRRRGDRTEAAGLGRGAASGVAEAVPVVPVTTAAPVAVPVEPVVTSAPAAVVEPVVTDHEGDGGMPPPDETQGDGEPDDPAEQVDTGAQTLAGEPLPEVDGEALPGSEIQEGTHREDIVPDTGEGSPAVAVSDPGHTEGERSTIAQETTGSAGKRRNARRAAGAGKLTCPEPGCGFRTSSEHGMTIHRGRAHAGGGDSA